MNVSQTPISNQEIDRILANVNTSLEDYQVEREANDTRYWNTYRITQFGISVIFAIATGVETYNLTKNLDVLRTLVPTISGVVTFVGYLLLTVHSSREVEEDEESIAGLIPDTEHAAAARHIIEQ